MEEWKEYKLGNILQISSGFAYKGKDIGYGNNCLLGMGCVSFKEKFLKSGVRNYNGDCPEKYCVKPNDMVLATRQQSDNLPILGMPAIIPDDLKGDKIIVGANLYKVENKSDFDSQYIYWLLKSPSYVDYIRSCQTGTTVRMITKANIESYSFLAPNKKCRDRIVSILSSLDDKIEVNRRINEQLEELAGALFKSWFVDFEPFKDGEFVDSELGMIPEGWKVGTLGDIASITSGKRPPIKQTEMSKDVNIPLIGASSIMGYTNAILYDSKILVIGRVGTQGVVQRFGIPCWPSDNTLIITSKFYEYCYQILKTIDYKSLNRGSTQPLITQTDIKNQQIILPSENVLLDFEFVISALMNKTDNNLKEITHLTTLRDTLLPKLMSGEIDVNEVKI